MVFVHFAAVLMALFCALPIFAANGVTYHGRLLDSQGAPVTSPVVRFKLQVRSPGAENCLMYQEVHTRDMSSSNGVFAITLNDGTASPGNGEPFSLDRVFQNRGVFNFASGKCALGTTYTPQLTDGRLLSVEFSDETLFGVGVWEALPAQGINSVPMAIESMTVGGYGSGSMLRVNDAGGQPDSVPALSSTQYAGFLNLLAGSSSLYLTSSSTLNGANLSTGSVDDTKLAGGISGAKINGNITGNAAGFTGSLNGDVTGAQGSTSVVKLRGRDIDTTPPSDGQVLKWNGLASRWEPSTPNSGSVTSVAATIPLRTTGGASPTLTIDDASTSAKGVVQLAGGSDTAAGLVVQANDLRLTNARAPDGAAGGDLGGNYPNPDVVKIRGVAVSSAAPTAAGQILRYDGTSQYVPAALGVSDIANLSTQLGNKLDQSLMPPSCGSNQTLNFSSPTGTWTCVSINNLAADKITSGTLDIARIPTGTSGMTVAVGNDARFPSSVCASGNKMRWDGSVWVCETDAPATANAILPSQAGNSGRVLTTNGSDVSWGSFAESDPKVGANAANALSKWNGSALVASDVYESGGNVGIGTTSPSAKLDVAGGVKVANDATTCDATKAGTMRWTGSAFEGCNGSAWVSLGGGGAAVKLKAIRQYSGTTTWTKPAGLDHVIVEVWGGGGGGGTHYYVGGTGGTSSFGAHVSAAGGAGGACAGESGGSGGAGVGGDINISGTAGGMYIDLSYSDEFGTYSNYQGGAGGGSPRGGGTGVYPGGGGSRGGSSTPSCGGGGGGYAQKRIDAASIAATVTITIGGGGAGGAYSSGTPGAAGMAVIYEYGL